MLDILKFFAIPINKEGYPFIAIAIIVMILFFYLNGYMGIVALILTLWCVYFFRDPPRFVSQEDKIVVSPADGTISNIELAIPPQELKLGKEKMMRISIFLSVFDVHVNRVPVAGKIEKLIYHPGKFFNATLDKASEDNERQTIMLKTRNDDTVVFTQIAGLVARRIVCNLEKEQEVKTGERFGIIRFGSRMDVYLPQDVSIYAIKGQKAIGGETIIAKLDKKGKIISGEEL